MQMEPKSTTGKWTKIVYREVSWKTFRHAHNTNKKPWCLYDVNDYKNVLYSVCVFFYAGSTAKN